MAIGLLLLVVQLVPDVGRLVPLSVGLAFLALFVFRRNYGLLVAGCIVAGVGVGVALQGAARGDEAGGIVVLSLGLGFLAIYVVSTLLRMAESHWWPLIPGCILAIIGTILLSGLDVEEALRWWPAVLVVIGLLLVGGVFVRPRR